MAKHQGASGLRFLCLCVLLTALWIGFPQPSAMAFEVNLKVKTIKACESCVLPAAPGDCQSVHRHWDQAAAWTPDRNVRIHAVSIPEQSEVSIYTDIEVSTAEAMYAREGHIFRMKYAGPGRLNLNCPYSFMGSNVTTSNIVFPTFYWIAVPAGTTIYVHMDVINWSPFEVNPMTQDVYLYYSEFD